MSRHEESPFQSAGGLDRDKAYVKRPCDEEFLRTVQDSSEQGLVNVLLAPPCSGKTSLLKRQIDVLAPDSKCFYLDLTSTGGIVKTQDFFDSVYTIIEENGSTVAERHKKLKVPVSWKELFKALDSFLLPGQRGFLFIDEINYVISSYEFFDALLEQVANYVDSKQERMRVAIAGIDVDCVVSKTVRKKLKTRMIKINDLSNDEMNQFTKFITDGRVSLRDIYSKIYVWTSGHPSLTQSCLNHLWDTGKLPRAGGVVGSADGEINRWAGDFRETQQMSYPFSRISERFEHAGVASGHRTDIQIIDKEEMKAVMRQVLTNKFVEHRPDDPIQASLISLGALKLDTRHGAPALVMRNQLFQEMTADLFNRWHL